MKPHLDDTGDHIVWLLRISCGVCVCVCVCVVCFFKLFFECFVFSSTFLQSLSFTQFAGLGWMTRSPWAHSSAFLGWIWVGRRARLGARIRALELAWDPGVCQAPRGQGQWAQAKQREVSQWCVLGLCLQSCPLTYFITALVRGDQWVTHKKWR